MLESLKKNKVVKKLRNVPLIVYLYRKIRFLFKIIVYKLQKKSIISEYPHPSVLSTIETIDLIVNSRKSVARFGDGEFRWMSGIRNETSFQKSSNELAQSLLDVLNSNKENIILCLPDVFESLDNYTLENQIEWNRLLKKYYSTWYKHFNMNRLYGDANFTRPYIDRKNKEISSVFFTKVKEIWKNRNVIIVEGDKTRFGVGNDLLKPATSVRRIIGPATNAFEKYDDIYRCVIKNYKNGDLVLLALGPTATILSSNLSDSGVQAIDIGHLDIEYEWFIRGVKKRVPIPGKYVNEVSNSYTKEDSDPSKYMDEIIFRIG